MEEKTFPYLPVALTLFIIGVVLLGSIWYFLTNASKTPATLASPIAVITHTPTSKLNLTTHTASPSSESAMFTFPTKQLTFITPSGWTISVGDSDTHQIVNWWLPDNTIVVKSSDKKPTVQIDSCPEGGCPDTYGATVTITDFGANAFTTPQAWYEGKASKDIAKSASSSAEAQSITTGTFLGVPVYCVSTSTVNTLTTPPSGIPAGIFNGICYLIWKGHVYAIYAALDDSSKSFQTDLTKTTTLLKSIKLL